MKQKTIILSVYAALLILAIFSSIVLRPVEDKVVVVQEEKATEYELKLNDDLVITKISNMKGIYVEDGSNDPVSSVGAIVVRNTGKKTAELLWFTLKIDNKKYEFQALVLPPNKSVVVQEKNRQSFPSEYEKVSAENIKWEYFVSEPQLFEDIFELQVHNGYINIKNISDKTVNGPIKIYYKNTCPEGYAGGITYYVEIPTLEVGADYTASAQNINLGNTEIMYINYVH